MFVTLVNVRVSAHNFAKKALDYSNDFDAAGQGKVCSCASVFNLFRLQPIGDILNADGKNWSFSPPEGDRINRSRRILAHKHVYVKA